MEIHHQSHFTQQSKHWKQYLTEGLMIFIAVVLGYAAENIRHHYVEEKKSIANLQNLYKDIESDSVHFSNMLSIRNKQDSCFAVLSRLYDQKKSSKIFQPFMLLTHLFQSE